MMASAVAREMMWNNEIGGMRLASELEEQA